MNAAWRNAHNVSRQMWHVRWTIGIALCLIATVAAGCEEGDCRSVAAVPAESFTNSIGMQMIKLSSGYYVSKYETRQSEYHAITACNPSDCQCDDCPVENLTGAETLEFCRALTDREHAAGTLPHGYAYTLPTFEQWLEYAAGTPLEGSVTPAGGRGGSQFKCARPVGSGEVNRLGIYDLRGNVSEYARDLYTTGSQVIVGAWWNTHRKDFLRINNKAGFMSPTEKGGNVGFRCVLVRIE